MPKIILTCERTLSADYQILLEGVLGTVATDYVPEPVYEKGISRTPFLEKNGELRYPPYGLRKIQSALLTHGFNRKDVLIISPEKLTDFVNQDTKIIGVSSGDPLGLGMTSTTMRCLWSGVPYTEKYFKRLSDLINTLKNRYSQIKFCFGGPGAWQLEKHAEKAEMFGIDHIFTGYGEKSVPRAFQSIVEGRALPRIIHCDEPSETEMIQASGAASMGCVEISRGCGRGCVFCTMKKRKMIHVPEPVILHEIRQNVDHGQSNLCLLSEDFLLYKSDGITVRKDNVKSLFEKIARIPGIEFLQLEHVNISSVEQTDSRSLRTLHDLIALGKNNEWIWVNAGIETASPRLLARTAPGKAAPYDIEKWPEMVRAAVKKLNDAGFFPFLSVMIGLPGETDADIQKTIALLDQIRDMRTAFFPVLYVGTDLDDRSFLMENMNPLQWELFSKAYEMNFKWVPKLYNENHKSGGVSLFRRLTTQIMGQAGAAAARRRIRILSRPKT